MNGEEFLKDFLNTGKNQGMASDADGFVTLTDKEGNTYVAQTNKSEKERFEKSGKPLSKVKAEKTDKAEKKTKEKKEPKTEEKKIKITDVLGGKTELNYELTEEQAKKQLKTSKEELEYNKNKVKDFTEKLKVVDKKLPVVDNLYNFYKDYKAASQYFNKYKDRFVDVKGEALKKIKSDTSLSYQKTESKLEDLEKEYKDLHGDKYFYTEHIKHQKNEIKRHTNIIKQLENLAQDSALDKYLDNVNLF